MSQPLDFFSREPEKFYTVLAALVAAVAALVIIVMGLRRAGGPPEKPHRLSALAGLSFWTALVAFGTMSVGFLLLVLIRRSTTLDIGYHDFDEMLLASTVLGMVSTVAAIVSALLSLAAIGTVRANRERGLYGLGLAALSLALCAIVIVGLYVPGSSLTSTTKALHGQIKR